MTITYHIYTTFVKPFIQAGLEMYRLDATHTQCMKINYYRPVNY